MQSAPRILIALAAFLSAWQVAAAYEVTVDNVDPHQVEVSGTWRSTRDATIAHGQTTETEAKKETLHAAQHGFEYLDDRGRHKGRNTVSYLPRLEHAGKYRVSLWYPAGPDRSKAVPVDVHHDEGVRTITVDQTRNGGAWHQIGTFKFTSTSPARVVIRTDGTQGRVIADAVRFELEGQSFGKITRAKQREAAFELAEHPMLLVDDFAIAEQRGLRRIYPQAAKIAAGNPIVRPDRPWEIAASFGSLATVIRDEREGIFKMWYWPQRFMYALATSRDGLTWTKDPLGLVEWQGSKENNLIPGEFGKHLLVYHDLHETDPAHRYKGVTDSRKYSQARLVHSADGLNWLYYHNGEPVTYRAADFTNHVLWDPAKKAHLLFTRTDYGTTGGAEEFRGVRTMINADLKNDPDGWRTLNNWILERPGDLPNRRQVYFLIDQIYAGVHIGLVAVYEHIGDHSEGGADIVKRHERDVLNAYVVFSRDGIEWDVNAIYDAPPLIERGADGAFDKDVIMPSSFVTHGDEHLIYYNGWNERHNMAAHPTSARAIGAARLPRDRFSGLRADGDGSLITRPFRVGTRELELNANIAAGRVRVEVLDESGRPIAGFAGNAAAVIESKDAVRLPITWRDQSFASLQGKTVRLRFHLTNAEIFAFGYKL